MKSAGKTLFVIFIIILTNAVTVYVLWPEGDAAGPAAAEKALVNVVVREIQPVTLPDAVLLPASVEAAKSVTVPAEVAGAIETSIEEGVPVAEGAIITSIDTRTLAADLDQAKANHDLAKSDHDRAKSLYEKGAASVEQYDQAKAQLAVAKARFEAAQVALDKGAVKAPIGGILNRRFVEKGEYVSPGDPIARIVKVDTVKVVVDVPEKDISYLAVGAMMGVRLEKESDLIPGMVAYRSVIADPGTLTYRVEIAVANPDMRVLPGMIVRVVLLRRMIENTVAVPLFAVVPREGRAIAYVEKDGVAYEREVTLGVTDGENIQIKSGLQTGDRLVVEGHRQLKDGQAVSVVSVAGGAR